MFVFVAAVPALLVVVLGYVVGFAAAGWVCDVLGTDPGRAPETAGWTTGLVLLAVVVRVLIGLWRRRSTEGAHQK